MGDWRKEERREKRKIKKVGRAMSEAGKGKEEGTREKNGGNRCQIRVVVVVALRPCCSACVMCREAMVWGRNWWTSEMEEDEETRTVGRIHPSSQVSRGSKEEGRSEEAQPRVPP